MANKGHIGGDKKRGKHTTVIPAAEDLIRQALRLPQVTGISAGFIQSGIHTRQARTKFKIVPAGLEVVVLGTTSKQTIYLFTKLPREVAKLLGGHIEREE